MNEHGIQDKRTERTISGNLTINQGNDNSPIMEK